MKATNWKRVFLTLGWVMTSLLMVILTFLPLILFFGNDRYVAYKFALPGIPILWVISLALACSHSRPFKKCSSSSTLGVVVSSSILAVAVPTVLWPTTTTINGAICAGDHGMVRFCILSGADPNLRLPGGWYGELGWPPLAWAAHRSDASMVQILLDGGANPRGISDSFGMTILHVAAGYGQLDVVRVLVTAGAPVDAPSEDGTTPLMEAASLGRSQVFRALLEWGADRSKTNKRGNTALDYAIGSKDAKTIEALELEPE